MVMFRPTVAFAGNLTAKVDFKKRVDTRFLIKLGLAKPLRIIGEGVFMW